MSLWFEESTCWLGSKVIRKMLPSVLFSYASIDSSTDAGVCFFGGLGRGEVCPFDSARCRFNGSSAGVVLTVGASAPFEVPALSLVKGFWVGRVEGVGALVMLIFGLGPDSAFSPTTGAVEEEEASVTPSVCDVAFGPPDSISSRRRRICNAQRLATSSSRTTC